MKCKDYQALMIDDRQEGLSGQQKRLLAHHVKGCPDCLEFQLQLEHLRRGLKKVKKTVPPSYLEQFTRNLCHRELDKIKSVQEGAKTVIGRGEIPGLVYTGLMTLVVVTLILIFPAAGELTVKDSFVPGEIFTFILILQNAVMLLLSPLLVQAYRKK